MSANYSIIAYRNDNDISLWGFKDIFNYLKQLTTNLKSWLKFKAIKNKISENNIKNNTLFYITLDTINNSISTEEIDYKFEPKNLKEIDFSFNFEEDKFNKILKNQTPVYKFLKLILFDLQFKYENNNFIDTKIISKNGKIYITEDFQFIFSAIEDILKDKNLNYYNKLYILTL